MSRLFTSESVTEGHPDKVADALSDAVLDAMLAEDPHSRTAIETLVANGVVIVTGEATTEAYVDIAHLVREKLAEIGYNSASVGLDGASCGVMVALNNQSPDISMGVNESWETRNGSSDPLDRQGAGDQGLMFGFACNETPNLMPMPIDLAHRTAAALAEARKSNEVDWMRPDGKTQFTVVYDDEGKPVAVDTVVISTQHSPEVTKDVIDMVLETRILDRVFDDVELDFSETTMLFNPTGIFTIGGPMGDSGLTGRKIIVDTYGGMARHGGGAFSGKDPSKVDRSASYAMRWVAKNVVAAGLADRCEAQVAYAIGKSREVGFYIDTFGTGIMGDDVLAKAVREVFDLRPAAIIRDLDLLRPIYAHTTNYGHFGREEAWATWEQTNRVDDLRSALKL